MIKREFLERRLAELSLIENESKSNSIYRNLIRVLLNLDFDTIDQINAQIVESEYNIFIQVPASRNKSCSFEFDIEGANLTMVIGLGVTYIDNTSIDSESKLQMLTRAIYEYLEGEIIEEVISCKNDIVKVGYVVKQEISGQITPVYYSHIRKICWFWRKKSRTKKVYAAWL